MGLLKGFVKSKLKQFHAAATSAFTQSDAERIWAETAWKFGLSSDEVLGLMDGWSEFVVTGNTAKMDSVCEKAASRLDS